MKQHVDYCDRCESAILGGTPHAKIIYQVEVANRRGSTVRVKDSQVLATLCAECATAARRSVLPAVTRVYARAAGG
jgi:hypothetical protein